MKTETLIPTVALITTMIGCYPVDNIEVVSSSLNVLAYG